MNNDEKEFVKSRSRLDLKNDYVFKRIFAKPENNQELKEFIEAILGIQIGKIEVKNPEITKNYADERLGVLDIRAQIDENTIIDVEMQVANVSTLVDRNIGYGSRLIAEDTRVRTVLTRTIQDIDGKDKMNERIKDFIELYETRNRNDSLITYTVAPHALYTCSGECLSEVAKLAEKYNLPVHVHFLESIDEIEDIKQKHGEEAIYVLKKYFNNVHTILAHCVKLDDKDIEILKGMDCGIAHNPVSNLRLGCKIADITKYLDNGINVALGTDGQGSGSNLDMIETMKIACLMQGGIHENEKRITAKDVIKMATINGAKLLKLDNEIGSIEIGKKADIIILDMEEKLDNITTLPNLNEISNIVYNINGRNVVTTIINGNILMEERKIKNLDLELVLNQCNKVVKEIKEALN